MTPSTTNTAARELLAEMRAYAALVRTKEGDADQALTIEGYADALEATLTQQQGGEQEAMDGLPEPVGTITVHDPSAFGNTSLAKVYSADQMLAFRDLALRTKQPAASEGDGRVKCLMCGAPCIETSREMLGENMQLEVVKGCRYAPPRYPADEEAAMQWPRGVMNRDKTLELLISHNEWRRGKEGPQTDPRLLGLALDAAIAALAGTP